MRHILFGSLCAGAVTLGLLLAPGTIPTGAASASCDISGVERVVAIGDVHGAYDRLTEILRTAGLVDEKLQWTGGKAHLVQLGDNVDRGPDSRKALDLLKRLTGEAESAGGQVHVLLGNHEIMRMLGDMRYTTPGEFEAFATDNSEQVRQRLANMAKAEDRDELLQKTPLGWVEMRLAFQPDGDYAKWLTSLDTVIKIDGVEFLHGGISPAVADTPCDVINDTVRRDMTSDFEKTVADPLRSLAAREDGPFWYRGLAQEPDTFAPELDQILSKQHARAVVVAHTVTPNGRIASRFEGKVFVIDTGMQPAYVTGGRASALEIRGGVFTAIYLDRKDLLSEAKQP